MDESDFIPTRGSALKRKAQKEFEAVTFVSYKPKAKLRRRIEDDETEETPNDDTTSSVMNMKRAKHEVIKFGMSGFSGQQKKDAKVQLAIQLGAKPPKNKNINYKQLLVERKKDSEQRKKQLAFQQLGKNQIGKSTAKGKKFDKNRKKGGDILDIYGTVKKADIMKTNNPKRKQRR